MTRFLRLAVPVVLAVLFLGIVFPAYAFDNPFTSPRGSADFIDGTTVLIAIFVSDPVHSWDFDRKVDFDSYSRMYYRLKTACEWLTKQARRYSGANPRIIWDWYNNDSLYYEYTSDRYLCDQDYTYGELRDFICDHIDLQAIQKKYRADNVIFFAYYNQDIRNPNGGYAWSWDFSPNAGSKYALEIIWISDEDSGLTVSAAGMAHEMMHCFGAVDLYNRQSKYVTAAYVDHLRSIGSRDIMYTIDYYTPDAIGETFSELDAYYMGLIRWCDDVAKYGLAYSSFDQ